MIHVFSAFIIGIGIKIYFVDAAGVPVHISLFIL
jgi:hypothetical protein